MHASYSLQPRRRVGWPRTTIHACVLNLVGEGEYRVLDQPMVCVLVGRLAVVAARLATVAGGNKGVGSVGGPASQGVRRVDFALWPACFGAFFV